MLETDALMSPETAINVQNPAAGHTLQQNFLTANGSRDSHAKILARGGENRSPNAGKRYSSISWATISKRIDSPARVEKQNAPFVILSSYIEHDGRTHAVQLERGVFWGLAVDIDHGNPTIGEVVAAVSAVTGGASAEIYSSSSSCHDCRKWRVLIPLAAPLAGADYADTQAALFELLKGRGLQCDATLARVGQPVFLPNVPPARRGEDGVPLFYEYHHAPGGLLELLPGNAIIEIRESYRAMRAARVAGKATRAVDAAAKNQKPQHQNSVINNTKSTGNFGRAKKYAARWKPVTENKNIAFLERACMLFEKFNISEEQAYNLCSDNNGRSDDPLSGAELEIIVGNACSIISKKGSPSRRSGYSIVRTELYTPNTADIVPLKAWRAQMRASRVASIKGEAGIFFDGSPVGAGKNYADITILKTIGASITLLPTHDACGELAKLLVEKGLNAAAHPAMNEASCVLYGSEDEPGIARNVLKVGLNVGAVLCPTCKFKVACDYQKARAAAREADHEIMTHTKNALNNFWNPKNKKLFLIHEDPTDLLRPFIKISDVEGLKKLKVVAETALERAQKYNFPEKISGVRKLISAVDFLLHELLSNNLIEDIRRSDRKTVGDLPSVAELPTNDPSARPDGWESFLYDSMKSCNIFPPGNTVKLCNGFAYGEYCTLAAVVDTIGRKNPKYKKAIIGVTQNVLPDDGIVWFEDASSTAAYIEHLLGVPVIDKTPSGQLANVKEPIQFARVDINKTKTSGSTVRNIVRTLIARNKAQKVGIICHEIHKPEIKMLAKSWRARIHKIEHFRSGKDKASNAWLDCDLLIILGTPRVPPVAIRDGLILLGDIAGANRNPVFGSVAWQGKDSNGAIINITGRGYQDNSWQSVYKFKVKEALVQAIGRARSVTDKAVPVVVVSNENINNLIISENPCKKLSDTVDRTYQRLLTDKIPNSTIIGKVSVIKPQSKTDRRHLSTLHTEGLLKRLGERRGYELL